MIKRFLYYARKTWAYKRNRKKFGQFGKGSCITKPLRISQGKNIYIGKDVEIHDYCWLASIPLTGADQSKLIVEDGVVLGDFCHIFATESVIIHKNVLFANSVYVADNSHGFSDISIPIKLQNILQKNPVEIGEGTWIGEHVCIIGATIGKNCVIGANAVVTHDIPDFCVAVGIPARIIKRFNSATNTWESTDKGGDFI